MPWGARFWEEAYAGHPEGWFFGTEPSTLARRLIHFFRQLGVPLAGRLLELGCGEGRDVIFFAAHGFDVEAIDGSPTGVVRTSRALEDAGLLASVALADISVLELHGAYDVVFANNSLQFVGGRALDRIRAIRESTAPGGWNAVGMFVEGEGEPEHDQGVYLLQSKELKSLYRDWRLLEYGESLIYSPRRGAYRSFANLIARRPV